MMIVLEVVIVFLGAAIAVQSRMILNLRKSVLVQGALYIEALKSIREHIHNPEFRDKLFPPEDKECPPKE